MTTSSLPIESLLDSCATAILERDHTVEDCLGLHPERRQELEPLLNMVARLRAARTVQAPPEFRRTTIARVTQQIAAHPHTGAAGSVFRRLRQAVGSQMSGLFTRRRYALATMVVGLLVIVCLAAGTGVAHLSVEAAAGDTLYPVKRTVEGAQLTLTRDELRLATLRLLFADRRLQEVVVLLQRGQYQSLDATLTHYASHLELIKPLLSGQSPLTMEEQLVLAQRSIAYLDQHRSQLEALLSYGLLPSTETTIKHALATEQEIIAEAVDIMALHDARPLPTSYPTPLLPTHTLWLSPTAPVPATTPAPGGSPAGVPVASPTPVAPTPKPTGVAVPPRSSPSPGAVATHIPDPWPTAWPTHIPTGWPTYAPTAWPTYAPTAWPTYAPTAWPTGVPTEWATYVPTAWPTAMPTDLATYVPTAWPTAIPTALATYVPTAWPTAIPTELATYVPTAWPTAIPTAWPTPPPTPQVPPLPPQP